MNNFERKLILSIIETTLFEGCRPPDGKLYLCKDFIDEQRSYLKGESFNKWLRVIVVEHLLNLTDEDRDLIKHYFNEDLNLLKYYLSMQNDGRDFSDEISLRYIEAVLDRMYSLGIVDGVLIEFVCDKLDNLIWVSEREINKGYISKKALDENIALYV